MNWKDVGKKIIGQVPLLGSLFAGGAGEKVGSLIAGLFGVDNKPDSIIEALKNDPDAIIKLKQLEADNKLELQRLVLEDEKLRLLDVQSARQREISVVKLTGKKDVNVSVISYVVISGFFALTGLLIFVALPEGSSDAIFLLFGALAAGFGSVIQYFFGSSKSSSDKTKMLGNQH